MRNNYGRLLIILLVGILVVGLGSTKAIAEITLSCTPDSATSNSVWNWLAVWKDQDGVEPTLRPETITEGMVDRGYIGTGTEFPGWYGTIGTIRQPIPELYDSAMDLYPKVPAPDGFTGFPVPPIDKVTYATDALSGELYQDPAYTSVQLDPTNTKVQELSTEGKLYDHGLDFCPKIGLFEIPQYISIVDHAVGISIPGVLATEPAAINADGTIPETVIGGVVDHEVGPVVLISLPQSVEQVVNQGRGVFTDEAHTHMLRSRPVNAINLNAAWPDYKLIEIIDPIPAGTTRLYIAYAFGSESLVFCKPPAAEVPEVAGDPPVPAVPEVLPTAPGILGADGYVRTKANGVEPWLYNVVIPKQTSTTGDAAVINEKPIVVLAKPPVALVGVWNAKEEPIKARITTPAEVKGEGAKDKGWLQRYNVIEITDSSDIFKDNGSLTIAYYCAGTHYVLTKFNPMPMPYTVYKVPLGDDKSYVRFNHSITQFDRLRNADPGAPGAINADLNDFDNVAFTKSLTKQCGIMGIYLNEDIEQADPTNYFDPSNGGRYEQYMGFGKAYFSQPLPDGISEVYVKVSTNAVDSVILENDLSLTPVNYYRRNALTATPGAPIGYCARSGIIRLGTPLPEPGLGCKVTYRALSHSLTVGTSPNAGLVTMVDDLSPDTAYAFESAWVANDGRIQGFVPDLPFGTYAARISYDTRCLSPIDETRTPQVFLYPGKIPMRYIQTTADGMEFRVSVSAGLNMSNPKQHPSDESKLNGNMLIYDRHRHPMYYMPSLRTDGTGPVVRKFSASGKGIKDGKELKYEVKDKEVTVHDSSGNTGMIDHGGHGNLDWLTCFSDPPNYRIWPHTPDVDPLAVEPLEEANPTYPDDGSGTTQFVFRVRYHNWDGLPPLPWLQSDVDEWNMDAGAGNGTGSGGVNGGSVGSATGVVLYLDEQGTGDYKPHFMRPDLEKGGMGKDVYIYRVLPHHQLVWSGITHDSQDDFWACQAGNHLYQSLSIGTYHYFFACSDDSLTFDEGKTFPFEFQNDGEAWGETYYGWNNDISTGLDPSAPRAVAGYDEILRLPHRRYSSDGTTAYDSTLYVDRPTRVPHEFERDTLGAVYPWSAQEHPKVTCQLGMPGLDGAESAGGKPYDDPYYGYGRFYGTLFPFRSAVNPMHPGARGTGDAALLAETSGSPSNEPNLFRIIYSQIDGLSPIAIKLWINDASEKTGSAATGHTYRSYTMQRSSKETNPDYRAGVMYEYKLQGSTVDLPAGPHTYYFTADDGIHIARWPVRPDEYIYTTADTSKSERHVWDFWVPTRNLFSEHRNPDYIDNDYVPGPYVNHAPTITNPSVTPGTSKEGTHFLYKATYTDPDGQRLYSANITIQINDSGETRQFAMVPDPKYHLDPRADNSALYKSGMDIILDTATYQDFCLEEGSRSYYIEVVDDWGHQDFDDSKRIGELVREPAGFDEWITGPIISGNDAPTLSNGRVESADGTSNSATVWTFKANYCDINNDPPALIKLFIGTLQPLDKTVANPSSSARAILWDAGHPMLPANDDTIYSNGAEFTYQTRLGGPSAGNPGIQYYYAFEAYDGHDYATYKSSSKETVRSDAAGCFIMQDTESGNDDTIRLIRPMIARQFVLSTASTVLDPDPGKVGDIVSVSHVYTNEDLTGTDYFGSYADGIITFNSSVPTGKVWIECEADTPIVGPLPVAQPAPGGIIPDIEVFRNYSSESHPLLLTDQKNGFVSADGTDRAVVLMDGVAAYKGKPSASYAAPSNPATIASVEGVYWLDDPDPATKYTNYYTPVSSDPKMGLEPPIIRTGRRINGWTVALDNPDEVYKVLGVYTDDKLNGINYYSGAGYPNSYVWQEAWVMGTDPYADQDPDWTIGANVIWPTRPNDIASIKGVYGSMSDVGNELKNYMPSDIGGQKYFVVEGTWDAAGGVVRIRPEYNDAGVIRLITKITDTDPNVSTPAHTYFASSGYPYDGLPITPNVSNPAVNGRTVYVSYEPSTDFGDLNEFMALKRLMRLNPAPSLPKVYIAYYPPGNLDANQQITLSTYLSLNQTPYVKIWPKAFNAGDQYIALTKKLPDIKETDLTVESLSSVTAAASVLANIGEVTAVKVGNTDYYSGANGPLNKFIPGDKSIHLTNPLPSLTSDVDLYYVPKQRSLTIKYDDIRYTHLSTGYAVGVSQNGSNYPAYDLLTDTLRCWFYQGTTHFVSTGWDTDSINIVGNDLDPVTGLMRDIDGGVVGIWLNADSTGRNYFNPRQVGRYPDNSIIVRLSSEAPALTTWLYARNYQKGVYYVDRWNRSLRFDTAPVASDRIQVSYFFGTRMPNQLVANTLPELSGGKVKELTGSRNAQYVYQVNYTDNDGPSGQKPSYVKVYIDGVPYDMLPATQGTPVYKSPGALYVYTPGGGLAGGSHTYHFEASDGSAVAWFDKNGAHNVERGQSVTEVVDLDGPWINDPPQLANGIVAPNPVPGGIGTGDSCDYTVTVKDADNDPPFFFDPLRDATGQQVSGSPRVWVDSVLNDDVAAPLTAKIVDLERDPLENTKWRVIVCKVSGGNGTLIDPNWTTDQFAGKLLQISNGDKWSDIHPTPYLRVYLIQSNTANKLVIAADTLENDQLLVPVDPANGDVRYVELRINGLLMSKVDPSQNNYTAGVDYKITVPRLAVGQHHFHFTTQSRETKPLWLLAMPKTNQDPFSILVRFPVSGDLIGPNVISVTPTGNHAPEVSNVGASTLYRGPRIQYAAVASPTAARPSSYTSLQNVLGVYVNANLDTHLPAAQQVNYFDAVNTINNPPATGESVKLAPSLPAMLSSGALIQHGTVRSLQTVMPDVVSAIGSVTGVYLTSDPTLLTPYTPTSPSLNAAHLIVLGSALPAGTTDVYIKYKPATTTQSVTADGSGNVPLPAPDPNNSNAFSWNSVASVVGIYLATDTNKTNNLANTSGWAPGNTSVPLAISQTTGTVLNIVYVAWPPVYINYYAVEPNTAKPDPITKKTPHGVFTAGEPLTFKALYKDVDDNPPTYHDGVQGYVKVVFNDTNHSAQLLPLGSGSYDQGIPFGVTLTDVSEGTHPYHFEASDGFVVTRFPADQTGLGGNDEKVQINYRPTLSEGTVDRESGATTFTFSVVYSDSDNAAPPAEGVKVVLTSKSDPSKILTKPMVTTDSAPNYGIGVRYTVVVDATLMYGGVADLPAGKYSAMFIANDGLQDATPLVGPDITVRPDNKNPVIKDYAVFKLQPNGETGTGAGKTSDTFVYKAIYADLDDDAPVYISSGGQRQTALTLIIDSGPTEQRLPMTMVPPVPIKPNYVEGVWFQAKITGKKLGPGNHTYTVVASDGSLPSVFAPGLLASKPGPILMVPYIQIQVVGKDGEPITDRSIVGQEVLVKGQMYFPYNSESPDDKPSPYNNIEIRITKPDGNTVSLNASLSVRAYNSASPNNWIGDITAKYSGYVDPALITGESLTLTSSGQWIINVTWPGDALYDPAETDATIDGRNDQIRISVNGPSRTIAVQEPSAPATSTPVVDMVTPPMMIGATSPGGIFGYDRALAMQIIRWNPSSSQYFRYDIGGVFPPLQPGDAVWIKPKLGSSNSGSGYPSAEPLGAASVVKVYTTSLTTVPFDYPEATHINGVYLSAAKIGDNYYEHSKASEPFRLGKKQIVLTKALHSGTTQVYVDYVGSQSAVDEGWIALDNPAIEKAIVAGDPVYMHNQYRLVKVLAKAYPLQTGSTGSPVLDTETKLPLLKSCSMLLSVGWNQFGNIFFNWKKAVQAGTLPGGDAPPPPPGDKGKVYTTDKKVIGKVLGVYLNSALTGANYYQPGISTTPYRRGDTTINLTESLPAGTKAVYIRYEVYPREDVGIPINEVHVTRLGTRKTLAEAKTAGWISDYAWRYDANQRSYAMISESAIKAENRVLKAWGGYWIRVNSDCQLEIDPNTKYNGASASSTSVEIEAAKQEVVDMPPPAPD